MLSLSGTREGIAPPPPGPLSFPVLGVGAGVGCGGSCHGGDVVFGLLLPAGRGVVLGPLFPGGGGEVIGSLFLGDGGRVYGLSFPGVGEGLGPPMRLVTRGLARGIEGSETGGLRRSRRSR